MAFGSAGGYTNLPSGNFTPQIFSQKGLEAVTKARPLGRDWKAKLSMHDQLGC